MSSESTGMLRFGLVALSWRRSSFKSANSAVCAWEASLYWDNVVVRFLRITMRLLLSSVISSQTSDPEGAVERSSIVADITADVKKQLAN